MKILHEQLLMFPATQQSTCYMHLLFIYFLFLILDSPIVSSLVKLYDFRLQSWLRRQSGHVLIRRRWFDP